jgi:hypothetical protein
MSSQGPRAIAAVARLRAALEDTAGSLAAANLEGLLRSEGELELSLRNLPPFDALDDDERTVVLDEAQRARLALQRCHRFGDVLLHVVRATFEAQGRTSEYGPREGTMTNAPRTRARG